MAQFLAEKFELAMPIRIKLEGDKATMATQSLRVKLYLNGTYCPINAEGSKAEMEELEMYLHTLFGTACKELPKGYWYDVDTLDDENDFFIYLVKENPNPKDGSWAESIVRVDLTPEIIRTWAGIQHRLDKNKLQYDPFEGTVNLVFELEGGQQEVDKAALERKAKEDALKMMVEALKKAEAHVERLRKNIQTTKAELAAF